MSSPTGPPPGRVRIGPGMGGSAAVAVAVPAGDRASAGAVSTGGTITGVRTAGGGEVSGARPAAICAWRSSSSMSSWRAGVSPAIGFLSVGTHSGPRAPRLGNLIPPLPLLFDEREIAEQHRPQDWLAEKLVTFRQYLPFEQGQTRVGQILHAAVA